MLSKQPPASQRYTHGEAVAMGMRYESSIAMKMGLVNQGYINRLSDILRRAGLPTQPAPRRGGPIVERMIHDKKCESRHCAGIAHRIRQSQHY